MVWPWFENVSVVWTLSPFFRKNNFFSTTKICHFSASQMQWVGTFWVKLLLQFYFELFETLQTFCSWSEDVHVVWTSTYKYFYFPFFQRSHVLLSHIQWVGTAWVQLPLQYSIPIFCKLCKCFVPGLKMCMRFQHCHNIIFSILLLLVNLVIFRHLIHNECVLCELNSSHSFISIFLKLFETVYVM